ncbi:MAG: S8 family serine peptidase [Acidobacteriia bacterium]|nr:S8 family serine peptidase [Terriglobia bacterium]
MAAQEYVPGRLLARPRGAADAGAIRQALALHRAAARTRISGTGASVVEVPEESSAAIMKSLAATGLFEYVERDYYAHTANVPNDPWYSQQWYVPSLRLPQAWDITTGAASVVVAIVDSGVDATHPDLASKLVPGWNFLTGSADTADVLGHGTAVAGTAAASSNNGAGGAGVSWGSGIMPLAVVDADDFAAYSNIAAAIEYAADHGVRIINVSIGGTNASAALQDAVDYAWSKGAIVFAAAMNTGSSTPYYPAACNHAVAVSATDSSGALASFSNFGPWVALSAPGANIFAPVMGGGYGYWFGTSFASPIAAGIAALALSVNPALSNTDLVNLLEKNADDLGAGGFDPYFGWGRVNAYRTVLAALPPSITVSVTPQSAALSPGQTQQLTATVEGTTAPVTWSLSPVTGSISSTGLYTAPAGIASTQSVTISASVPGARGTAAITLNAPAAPPEPPVFKPVRINAGGPAYVDAQGQTWSADTGFSGGSTWSTSQGVAGTAAPALYQSQRWGAFSYGFTVPNGSYLVTLKFSEISQFGVGARVFDVALNGAPALAHFDIFAQAGGGFLALDKTFPVTVSNGQINIAFTPGAVNWPEVNGIQIVAAGVPAFSPIRVNAGGDSYSDASGKLWSADYGSSGGSSWATAQPVSNTAAQPLYQTQRWGAFSYQFAVPNGWYVVTLRFSETSQFGVGARIFDVGINGASVLAGFDIFAQAGGGFLALDKTFPVTVSNGQIDIAFTPGSANWPMVNAIEILAGGAPSGPAGAAFRPGLPGSGRSGGPVPRRQ